jgi:hypothetical protein
LLVGNADDQGSATREFGFRNLSDELEIKAEEGALLACGIVEEINNVSSEAVFDPATFLEIEGAGRVHFQRRGFAEAGAQLALKSQPSLPHLGHGECYDVIHKLVLERRAPQDSPGGLPKRVFERVADLE